MGTRFTPSDDVVGEAADGFLAAALRSLAVRTEVAAAQLREWEPEGRWPEDALKALMMWRRVLARLREDEDEILALLIMRGASKRGLADALGMRPHTVATRVAGRRATTATSPNVSGMGAEGLCSVTSHAVIR